MAAALHRTVQNANALPLASGSHTASQQVPRLKCGRGAGTARSVFFRLGPGLVSWLHTDLYRFLDSVRLALSRPPNLESQYQRM